MSAYARLQFCMRNGESPSVELRQHSELPVLMLTHENSDFTMDGTPETLRAWLTSILAHPMLATPKATP